MYILTTWAFLARLLISGTNAQTNTVGTCEDIKDSVRSWNSSSTRQIQALKLDGESPRSGIPVNSRYALVNDSSKTWDLSIRVQSTLWDNRTDNPLNNYVQAMFLNTKDSNMTDIGSCHQTMQASVKNQGYLFTKAVLERSLNDNGDCTTMIGNECVQALKKKYIDEAAQWPLRTGHCAGMNNTIPAECSGVLQTFDNQQMNLTYVDSEKRGNLNSRFDPDTECNGVKALSTHILTVGDRMAYDDAVRFPIIDVISFWPNRSTGMQNFVTNWKEDVRVEIFCIRPDEGVRQNSTIPSYGKDLLNAEGAKFPTTSSAVTLKEGILRWMSAAVMGAMLLL